MHKGLRVLFLGLLGCIFVLKGFGQTAASSGEQAWSLMLADLPEIKGISKADQDYRKVPMSVYVISKEEIERWGVRGLYETLARVPGYSFYNTDYYGQYGVMARGFQSIWRYGCSVELMNIVDFGHWEFTPHFFKTIEVARGPAGLMWGSGAEAGLMNFNIRDDLRGLETAVEYGEKDRRATDIMYGNKFNTENKDDGFFLGWHYERQGYDKQTTANFYANSAVRNIWKENGLNPSQTFLGKLQYKNIKFLTMYDQADTIAPRLWYRGTSGDALENDINARQGNVHDQLPMLTLRGEYHIPEEQMILPNTNMYFYADYYKKQWYTEGVALDTQKKQALGVNFETEVFKDIWKLRYGGDFWGQESTTDPSFTSSWAVATHGIDWYASNTSPSKTTYRNMYLESETNITKQLTFTVGTRADWQKNVEPQQTIWSGPRAALIYSPWETLTVKYIHNMCQRRPQANETSYNNTPSPENMTSDELVLLTNIGNKFQGGMTIFLQKMTNKITRIDDGSFNSFMNTGGIVSKGIEWDLKYRPIEKLLFYWNGDYINKCEVHISNVFDTEARDEQMRSLFVPKFSHFVGAEYDFNWVKLNVALRSVTTIPYQNMDLTYSKKDVQFMDLTIRSKRLFKDKVQLSLNCLNLFDKQNDLPAFGEHAGNGRGTLMPEGRRIYARVVVDW